MSETRKNIIRLNILKNHEKNLINIFKKYRDINEQHERSRHVFFEILKTEIISSLNYNEKVRLFQAIQLDIYSNPNSNISYEDNQQFNGGYSGNNTVSSGSEYNTSQNHEYFDPRVNQQFNGGNSGNNTVSSGSEYNISQNHDYFDLTDIYSSPNSNVFFEDNQQFNGDYFGNNTVLSGSEYNTSQNHDYFDPRVNQQFNGGYSGNNTVSSGSEYNTSQNLDYYDPRMDGRLTFNGGNLTSKSGTSKGNMETDLSKRFKDLSISDKPKETNGDNLHGDLPLVKELFRSLTGLISKGETIIDEIDNIKKKHGEDIYKKVVKHSPADRVSSVDNVEPLTFQLALKLDKYESTLDILVEQDLLNFSQKNRCQLSIFNVLLSKDFHSFIKFLSYIDRKKLDSTIQYVSSKNDFMFQLTETGQETEHTSHTKILEDKGGDEFMINQGIIYSRHLLIKKDVKIVEELVTHNYLHAVLYCKIGNDKPYIWSLAERYPNSKSELEQIVTGDWKAIVHSSFMVWLAQRDLNHFYEFVKSLIFTFKINKEDICRALKDENVDGTTIPAVIKTDDCRRKFPISAVKISEFIEKYGIPSSVTVGNRVA